MPVGPCTMRLAPMLMIWWTTWWLATSSCSKNSATLLALVGRSILSVTQTLMQDSSLRWVSTHGSLDAWTGKIWLSAMQTKRLSGSSVPTMTLLALMLKSGPCASRMSTGGLETCAMMRDARTVPLSMTQLSKPLMLTTKLRSCTTMLCRTMLSIEVIILSSHGVVISPMAMLTSLSGQVTTWSSTSIRSIQMQLHSIPLLICLWMQSNLRISPGP